MVNKSILLVIAISFFSCLNTKNQDYQFSYQNEIDIEKTLIRNQLIIKGKNTVRRDYKEFHLVENCSCTTSDNSLDIRLDVKVEERVEKSLQIHISDGDVKQISVLHILDGNESNARKYDASTAILKIDTTDNNLIKGQINISCTNDEVDQIVIDNFEGMFICDKSTINLD